MEIVMQSGEALGVLLTSHVYLAAVVLGSAGWITLVPMLQLRHLEINGALKGESPGSTLTLGALARIDSLTRRFDAVSEIPQIAYPGYTRFPF
ncbi:MAG: hypothetical protein ACRD52_16770 [Candidatus Acidiferrales bacterium]